MHKTLTPATLALVLCTIGLAPAKATADITITDLQITENGFSLSITGTLPTNTPFQYANTLTLVNADYSQGRIFGTYPNTHASSSTSTTGAPLSGVFTGIWVGADYIVIQSATDLLPDNALNGTITGTWSDPLFNPEYFTAASRLLLYWGAGMSPDPATGVFLAETSGAIPEPSTVALLSAGAAALIAVAVRRRRKA